MEVQLKENKDTFAKLKDELEKQYQNAQAKVTSNLQD